MTCLVTLFDCKLQVFKNSPKWTIFGIFNQLLSTQNVNVARFARTVEWDFFCDFQTPCLCKGRIYVQLFSTALLYAVEQLLRSLFSFFALGLHWELVKICSKGRKISNSYFQLKVSASQQPRASSDQNSSFRCCCASSPLVFPQWKMRGNKMCEKITAGCN